MYIFSFHKYALIILLVLSIIVLSWAVSEELMMHTSSFFTIKCSDLFILKKMYGAISSELVQESGLKSYENYKKCL